MRPNSTANTQIRTIDTQKVGAASPVRAMVFPDGIEETSLFYGRYDAEGNTNAIPKAKTAAPNSSVLGKRCLIRSGLSWRAT